MSHQVLSRKYRPQGFDELVGQAHVGRILRNALLSGRVGHAYLFVGPRGVGKTTTARIFAKALNCAGVEGDAEAASSDPCGVCPSCGDIAAGSDLDVVEMDAASNNHVEDVRRLREQVGYATVRSRYRIWIVDEVHMLSMPAFNAFLKTLEEPPAQVIFIFCTTEEHKLPDTFRSRCQRIEFRPIGEAGMAGRLEALATKEGVTLEDGLAADIASAALGGLRDAESLLEQLLAASPDGQLRRADLDLLAGRAPRALLESIEKAVDDGEAGPALDAVDAALAGGCKPGVLLEQWMESLRRRLVLAARGGEGAPSLARTTRALDVLLAKRAHLRSGADGTLVCQVAAVELARLPDARDLDRLLAALKAEGAPQERSAPAAAVSPAPASVRPPAARPRARSAASPDRVRDAASSDRTSGAASSDRAPSALPVSAERVLESWDAFVARASSVDSRLGEALRRVQPGAVGEGVVTLNVPAADVLARSTLDRREAVLLFRRVAGDVLGVELAPRVVVDDTAAAPPAPRAAPEEHPMVRLVREETQGQLMNLESDDESSD